MKLPCRTRADAAFLSVFLLPYFAAAIGTLDCDHLRSDGIKFDFSELGGPRSVVNATSARRTTYTIDICSPLKVKKGKTEPQCPNGSRICSTTHLIANDSNIIEEVFPIAGELQGNGGGNLNAKWNRLKNSPSHSDSEKEGLSIVMNGGFRTENGKKTPQKAIIEFVCDKSKTGLENLPTPEDKYMEKVKRDKDENEEEDEDEDSKPSLQFVGYRDEDNVGVLRLTWLTEHACEDSAENQERSQRWGFFTWFIIIAFMSTAAYLIFGSWLNYNRYGARGWDLLPHSDTIRDVPYLLKDWIRRVVNTVQGGGSRGGYAAV